MTLVCFYNCSILLNHFVASLTFTVNRQPVCQTISSYWSIDTKNIFFSCWTELEAILDENFNHLKRPSHIHIQHFSLPPIHFLIFKMAVYKGAIVMVLTSIQKIKNLGEGKQDNGSKGGEKVAYFQNIFQAEDCMCLKRYVSH